MGATLRLATWFFASFTVLVASGAAIAGPITASYYTRNGTPITTSVTVSAVATQNSSVVLLKDTAVTSGTTLTVDGAPLATLADKSATIKFVSGSSTVEVILLGNSTRTQVIHVTFP